jgi:hypothetical protein
MRTFPFSTACFSELLAKRVTALACFLLLAYWQADAQIMLPPSNQQRSFPSDFSYKKASFPEVNGNALISFSRTIGKQDPLKGVFITPLDTSQQRIVPFWISGASIVHLDSAAIDNHGSIFVVGSYLTSVNQDDRQNFIRDLNDSHGINFLAKMDSGGSLLFLKDLGDYTAENVCVTRDNSLWAFGQSMPKEHTKLGQEEDYAMIRNYSSDGELVKSYLKRANVEGKDSPNYRSMTPSATPAFLVCGFSSVATFLQQPGHLLWSTIDLSTGEIAQVRVPTPEKNTVPTNIVELDNSSIYASFIRYTKTPNSPITFDDYADAGIFRLNRDSHATWQAVSSNENIHYSDLVGHVGDYIVHFQGVKSHSEEPTLFWTKAP